MTSRPKSCAQIHPRLKVAPCWLPKGHEGDHRSVTDYLRSGLPVRWSNEDCEAARLAKVAADESAARFRARLNFVDEAEVAAGFAFLGDLGSVDDVMAISAQVLTREQS